MIDWIYLKDFLENFFILPEYLCSGCNWNANKEQEGCSWDGHIGRTTIPQKPTGANSSVFSVLHCVELHLIALKLIALHFIALYCTVVQCIALY